MSVQKVFFLEMGVCVCGAGREEEEEREREKGATGRRKAIKYCHFLAIGLSRHTYAVNCLAT